MFRAPLCPSSGAHDDSVGYHIGLVISDVETAFYNNLLKER